MMLGRVGWMGCDVLFITVRSSYWCPLLQSELAAVNKVGQLSSVTFCLRLVEVSSSNRVLIAEMGNRNSMETNNLGGTANTDFSFHEIAGFLYWMLNFHFSLPCSLMSIRFGKCRSIQRLLQFGFRFRHLFPVEMKSKDKPLSFHKQKVDQSCSDVRSVDKVWKAV